MPQVEHCLVSEQESGQKILAYLKRKMGRDFPDSGLMRLIRTGQVRVNKRRCKPFDRIYTDDVVRIPPHLNNPLPASPCSGPLEIVYENHEFLALNKPGGLPVHPGTGHEDSLAGRVFSIYQEATFKPTPIHRLDKDTSGLILFAKSYSWLREIQNLWKSGQVEKVYQTWVNGKWEQGTGPIMDNLVRFSDKVRVKKSGKPALSWVTHVLQKKQISLLQISLATGRTHQIRVQLAERGFPVIGDKKYGRKKPGFNKMLLHCFKISWPGLDLLVAPDWPADLKPPEKLV